MATTTEERAVREKLFHDDWAASVNLDELRVEESFDSPTAIENRYALSQMGDLAGKRLLDIGCGAGETSVYFALCGAKVVASDISGGLLGLAQKLAIKFQTPVETAQAEAGNLPFSDSSFDIVFGNGVLHHVDLESASREISRVLKPGGKAIFIEPLPYNPVINVYRKLAKDVRTEDEKPLTFKQIRGIGRHFSSMEHKEFWLFSLLIFLEFFFVKRWHPSKVRYWKKVIEVGWEYQPFFSRLQKWDAFFLRTLPFLRPLCWNTVIVAQK